MNQQPLNPNISPALITDVLYRKIDPDRAFPDEQLSLSARSAVMFLMGCRYDPVQRTQVPCIILNKRSVMVKQPGDLCFPGGGISPGMDRMLADLLKLPGFPISTWTRWPDWRVKYPSDVKTLSLLAATALREGLEEMRLNPFGVRFLGPLPAQQLILFKKVIHPMAFWVNRQKRFFPNWEVEKVLHIPVASMLSPENYRCYRITYTSALKEKYGSHFRDMPSFLHQDANGTELLWGATYRIIMAFLKLMFGFSAPPVETLPIISGVIDEQYLTGGLTP